MPLSLCHSSSNSDLGSHYRSLRHVEWDSIYVNHSPDEINLPSLLPYCTDNLCKQLRHLQAATRNHKRQSHSDAVPGGVRQSLTRYKKDTFLTSAQTCLVISCCHAEQTVDCSIQSNGPRSELRCAVTVCKQLMDRGLHPADAECSHGFPGTSDFLQICTSNTMNALPHKDGGLQGNSPPHRRPLRCVESRSSWCR